MSVTVPWWGWMVGSALFFALLSIILIQMVPRGPAGAPSAPSTIPWKKIFLWVGGLIALIVVGLIVGLVPWSRLGETATETVKEVGLPDINWQPILILLGLAAIAGLVYGDYRLFWTNSAAGGTTTWWKEPLKWGAILILLVIMAYTAWYGWKWVEPSMKAEEFSKWRPEFNLWPLSIVATAALVYGAYRLLKAMSRTWIIVLLVLVGLVVVLVGGNQVAEMGMGVMNIGLETLKGTELEGSLTWIKKNPVPTFLIALMLLAVFVAFGSWKKAGVIVILAAVCAFLVYGKTALWTIQEVVNPLFEGIAYVNTQANNDLKRELPASARAAPVATLPLRIEPTRLVVPAGGRATYRISTTCFADNIGYYPGVVRHQSVDRHLLTYTSTRRDTVTVKVYGHPDTGRGCDTSRHQISNAGGFVP